MKIYDFRIEYREQPKGLAVKIPRFSWKIASGDNNVDSMAFDCEQCRKMLLGQWKD